MLQLILIMEIVLLAGAVIFGIYSVKNHKELLINMFKIRKFSRIDLSKNERKNILISGLTLVSISLILFFYGPTRLSSGIYITMDQNNRIKDIIQSEKAVANGMETEYIDSAIRNEAILTYKSLYLVARRETTREGLVDESPYLHEQAVDALDGLEQVKSKKKLVSSKNGLATTAAYAIKSILKENHTDQFTSSKMVVISKMTSQVLFDNK